jgi:alanyl-tRNA synthetase
MGALALVAKQEQTLKQLMEITKSPADELVDKVQALAASNRSLEKQTERLKAKLAASAGDDLSSQAVEINGIKLLIAKVDGFNPKSLRDTVDQLKNKLGSSIILLASTADGKVSLVAGVSKDLTDRVKAGELANMVAEQVGGKGGGRPDMAMAGGTDVNAVPAALDSVQPWLEGKL